MYRGICLPVFASICLFASVSFAAIINVPADQPSIQAAIDAAVDGDQVSVAPGVYNETINFSGKVIVVESSGGPSVTTIDGAGLNTTVVTCNSGEGPATRFSGFTVTGGNATDEGGGMQNEDSNPTVTDCVFVGNTGNNGGGMNNQGNGLDGTGPTVISCRFEGNTATNLGGGMTNSSSAATIIGCQFIDNTGSGMFINGGVGTVVINCLFTGNNSFQGGGLMSTSGGFAMLINSTIVGNTAVNSGAGINGGGFSIANCIIWGNSAPSTPNINGSPTVSYSLVQGGFAGVGNINATPQFVDMGGGDFRLLSGSPGVDAGDNGALDPCALDLDNLARFFDDLATPDTGVGGAPIVDMGAYESGSPVDSDCDKDALSDACSILESIVEDCNSNGVPDGCDIAAATSVDVDFSGRPDECEDCNTNGILDSVEIASGTSRDTNLNGLPDECEFIDCNTNGIDDADDVAGGTSPDCNTDFIPDECQLAPTLLMYGVVRDGPTLYVIDRTAASAVGAASMDQGVLKAFGLSAQPGTDQLYTIVSQVFRGGGGGGVPRQLATVNRDTGAVTIIGTLSEPLADIAFRANGTLYGIAGNGATIPGQVFVVLTTDATLIPAGVVGGQGGGHSIAFRTANDRLYHAFGERLEFINVGTGMITMVSSSLSPMDINAMTFDVFSGQLLAYTQNLLFEIDPDSGNSTFLGISANVGAVTGLAQIFSPNDCNANTIPDTCDIGAGTSLDTDQNGRPDECELVDCNLNGVHDADDLIGGTSTDCNADSIPDECSVDCNTNGVPDDCDLVAGASDDCNSNAIPDECEDCDANGVADECDIAIGNSADCNNNGIPDSCDVASSQFSAISPSLSPINSLSPQSYALVAPPLAISDVILEFSAIADLSSSAEFVTVDLSGDVVGSVFAQSTLGDCPGLPEVAQLVVPAATFNAALARGPVTINMVGSVRMDENCTAPSFITVSVQYDGSTDCNANAVPDSCDVADGTSLDCNANDVPDECEDDCNTNGTPDACDIATGSSNDTNVNGFPDDCEFIDCNTNGIDDAGDLAGGTSADCNTDFIPDECQLILPARIYGVERDSGTLYILDPVDASLTNVATMDQSVSQAYGLAIQPGTEQLYVVVSQSLRGGGGGGPRLLATLDRDTGAVAIIGTLAEPISDVAFRSDGTLYGISGNSATNPGEIHLISQVDATLSSTGIVRGNGGGQSIAFRPDTDRLYRAFDDQLEYIDVNTGGVTPVSSSLSLFGVNAMVFEPSTGQLIASSRDDVYGIDPDTGASQFVATASANLTGLISLIPTNDCNGNIVPDDCEADCNANGVIDSCDLITPGDFDADGDVDTDDYQGLADCIAGPGQSPNPLAAECVATCLAAFDQDVDGDIDLRDFAEIAILYSASLP